MTDDALAAARRRMADAFKVFVYCDDPFHAQRRVAVTNFVEVPGGGWSEVLPSRGRRPGSSAGRQLIADQPAEPGWALDPTIRNADLRETFTLECRKCRGSAHPIRCVARRSTLFEILNGLRRAGLRELPLDGLAATLSKPY